MDGEMLRENLKAIYKDEKAPAGFSSRVMQRIKEQEISSPSKGMSLRLKRVLRPVIAVAACFVLALGVYLATSGLPGVAPAQDLRTAEIPVEDEPMPGAQIEREVPYINGDEPVLTVEAKQEPVDLPSVAPPSVPADQIPLVNVLQANEDTALVPSPLPEPKPPASNGHSHTVAADKPLVIAPLAEREAAFVLREADIPSSSVFVSRRRVIDSVSLNISVGTINNALRKLEERERFFGISADAEVADIRPDGTIIMMRSYVVQTSHANAFAAHVNAIGSSDGIKRDRIDITQDYNRMLNTHRELLVSLARSGQGVRELNKIAEELLFLDERAQDGVKNVVVWLEDGVDL